MNITMVTGKPGSGRTRFLFDNLKKDQDNFVVTTDSSVFYIEREMSIRGFPGKCVGINSLAKSIFQETGGIAEELINEEIQIILLTDIMKANYSKLNTFKVIGYTNSLVNEISSVINECLIQNITPEKLVNCADKFGNLTFNKLKDIALIYEEFLRVLKEKHFVNNILFTRKIIDILNINGFKYKNIYIDSLNKYNPLIMDLLKSLTKQSDNTMVIFSVVSAKSYIYNIYKNSSNAYIGFDKFIVSLENCKIERVTLKSNKEKQTGLDIIKNELFNRDTETVAVTEDVFLHEASTPYKEVDFIVSQIKKLINEGYSYDDIIVTSTDMGLYKNALNNSFEKHGISSYYYKNKKVSQTLLFNFFKNIFNIFKEGYKVEYLLNLININYFNLDIEDINLVNVFFRRFGNDLEIAFKNGEIYDNDNFIHVKLIIDKLMESLDMLKTKFETCAYYTEFSSVFFDYIEELKLQETLQMQYEKVLGSKPQLANEIVETWNGIVNILDSIGLLDSGKVCSLKNFIDVLVKLCEETNLLNSQEYCDEIKILDLKDAQNRKSKICFILGCNEGKFPFDVKEGLFSDSEIKQINIILNSTLKTLDENMADSDYAIYSALTMPSDRLYISWAANDVDARPMRSAYILHNILKSFEKNRIQEKRFYDNDKEEVYYDLLVNLSNYRTTGIIAEDTDKEYWELSEDPDYSERLNVAVNNAIVDKQRINSDRVVEAYKEIKFFSVTGIECYSKCPFMYFMNYGILPKQEKLFEETAADKGTFFHDILNKVFNYIIENRISLFSIDYDSFKDLLFPIILKNINSHNENVLESNIVLSVEKEKMIRRIINSSWSYILQLREGDFDIYRTEFKIGRDIPLVLTLSNGEKINIIGTVDRIDEANINSGKYLRVIDYKSSQAGFSMEKVQLGIQLQLPIYMKAIIGDHLPAGIYYSKIIDAVKDVDSGDNNILKKYQLNGITVADFDILAASDRALDGQGSSNIIQAEITTKGEISKRSKVLEASEFNDFLNQAADIATKKIEEILSGNTRADPKKLSDFSSCDYCPYKALCHV